MALNRECVMARTGKEATNSAWVVSHFSPDRGEAKRTTADIPDGSRTGFGNALCPRNTNVCCIRNRRFVAAVTGPRSGRGRMHRSQDLHAKSR
ncbi:hypothetical protein EXIGLDRAFT_67238 [Exidia glandulosa HHB12029]|uniref:Uncharacterized protein n=1 Tax=Exidia glandulosa HHB12029 TaxID=1314781 RepID=A0A165I3B4_EXIGL|nr:hypothetical protein EXIGLDRAFT_67238 [Exidia glandulosa HHB12029]